MLEYIRRVLRMTTCIFGSSWLHAP